MSRGNKRDRDRERAQARKQETKGRQDGLTPEQRRERDAKALREKMEKKTSQDTTNTTGGDTKSKNKANQK